LRLIQNTQSLKIATTNPRAQQLAGSKISKSSYCNVATPTQCTLYNDSHRLFKCDRFIKLQPRHRHNHVEQQGLCFNCLQPFVKNHTCSQECRMSQKTSHSVTYGQTEPGSK
jgi:hypothetical protein